MKRSLLAIPLAALVALGAVVFTATPAAADPVEFIPVGSAPFGVAFTPDGTKAYVANRGDGTVSVIDVASSTVITTIPGVPYAMGVAVTPDGSKVYVTSDDPTFGAVAVIDTTTDTVLTTITLTVAHAESITLTDDGTQAYVTSWVADGISIISTVSDTLTGSFGTFSPTGVAFSADGSEAFITSASGNITRVDTSGPTILAGTIPAADTTYKPVRQGDQLFFLGHTTGVVFTASLIGEPTTFDPAPVSTNVGGSTVQALGVGSDLIGLVGSDAGAISVFDGASNTILDTFTEGSGGDFDSLAISPDGTVAYLTEYSASGQVAVIRWPAIAATAAPNPQKGVAYSFAVPGSGSRTLTYTVTGGTLPAGLALDSATGAIAGTPTASGTSTFTITVSSSLGSASHTYTVGAGVGLPPTGIDGHAAATLGLIGAGTLVTGIVFLLVRRPWAPASSRRH